MTKEPVAPENVHTIFNFNLPFAIPVPDGLYEIALGGKNANISIKRVQRSHFAGGSATGFVQIDFDKYGLSSYSCISIKFSWKLDLEEEGRTPLLIEGEQPRMKAKETVIHFLNRFIDAVRYSTQQYWIEHVRYQDLSSYSVSYWDGKQSVQAVKKFIDLGVGGIKVSLANPFQVEPEIESNLRDLLLHERPLDLGKMLLLNSKDACLQEDFRLAIIEAVIALEVVLYNFITVRGKAIGLSKEKLELIKKVGLTGKINRELKKLTNGLEQIDDGTLNECTAAITMRNGILHRGLTDVASTDTEKRILAINRMVDYLKRVAP